MEVLFAVPNDSPSVPPSSPTPDRIAADALIERALMLEMSGKPEPAVRLRELANRLLGGRG